MDTDYSKTQWCFVLELIWDLLFADSYSATSNSILDRAIDSEDAQHKDFLRLVRKNVIINEDKKTDGKNMWSKPCIFLQEHVEGYHELSAKTKTFFSTAVSKWDADFYVKVDDDVHVNLGTLLLLGCLVWCIFYFYNIGLISLPLLSLLHELSMKVCSLQPLPITVRSPESTLVVWSPAPFFLKSKSLGALIWILHLPHMHEFVIKFVKLFFFFRTVKYHEPEYWKFGEEGNKYFRHATGQIYAISKDLATYISINQ